MSSSYSDDSHLSRFRSLLERVVWCVLLGDFRFEYECEIEYENDFNSSLQAPHYHNTDSGELRPGSKLVAIIGTIFRWSCFAS